MLLVYVIQNKKPRDSGAFMTLIVPEEATKRINVLAGTGPGRTRLRNGLRVDDADKLPFFRAFLFKLNGAVFLCE